MYCIVLTRIIHYLNQVMSEYTRKYIYNKLLSVYEYKLGIVDTPFSEYISVKGELGL